MHKFKELQIWKRSRVFCAEIYNTTSSFPDSEKFGLTNQLRRASVSIPSNIAEGSSRKSNKDFARFLEITLGSVYEIETQLLIAFDLKFLNENELNILNTELNEIIKMISKFKSTLTY
jgi:four helix bundle protein